MFIVKYWILCFGLSLNFCFANDINDKAKKILQNRCFDCHGKHTKVAKNLDLLNINHIKSNLKEIISEVQDDLMPPHISDHVNSYNTRYKVDLSRLKSMQFEKGEKELLLQWLKKPEFNTVKLKVFYKEEDLLKNVLKHVETLSADEAKNLRFLTLHNLYNSGDSPAQLEDYRKGLSILLNSLSWQSDMQKLEAVPGTNDLVYKVYLNKQGLAMKPWNTQAWDRISSYYPYNLRLKGKVSLLYNKLSTKSNPMIRADWFAYATSRPPLYHDLLGLPKSLNELEKTLSIDSKYNVDKNEVIRAGSFKSGVSTNHRVIERHVLKIWSGSYWKSYDFKKVDQNNKRSDILKFPLAPGEVGKTFSHAGGEFIFNLPNGMQAYLITDEHGKVINSAPTDIVQNANRKDSTVINGVSCIQCHSQGIQTMDDVVRGYAEKLHEGDVLAKVLDIYPEQSVLDKVYQKDTKHFAEAMKKINVDIYKSKTSPFSTLLERFDKEIDLRQAAAELNRQEKDLKLILELLKDSEDLADLAYRLQFGIKRSDFIQVYPAFLETLKIKREQFNELPDPIQAKTPTHLGLSFNRLSIKDLLKNKVIANYGKMDTKNYRHFLDELVKMSPQKNIDVKKLLLLNLNSGLTYSDALTYMDKLKIYDAKTVEKVLSHSDSIFENHVGKLTEGVQKDFDSYQLYHQKFLTVNSKKISDLLKKTHHTSQMGTVYHFSGLVYFRGKIKYINATIDLKTNIGIFNTNKNTQSLISGNSIYFIEDSYANPRSSFPLDVISYDQNIYKKLSPSIRDVITDMTRFSQHNKQSIKPKSDKFGFSLPKSAIEKYGLNTNHKHFFGIKIDLPNTQLSKELEKLLLKK